MTKIKNIKPLGFPWETKDPFLFCAYHKDDFPAGDEQMGMPKKEFIGRNIGQDFVIKDGFRMYHGRRVPGFPYHPHKGFETITINKEGFVDHTDSLGGAGRFGEGDVQWMTAGKGILHSEMFPLIHQDKKNPLEIFQIWLNLPKVSKLVEPHFKMLWKDMIPVITETDDLGNKTFIDVIAGNYKGTQAPDTTPDSWAANPANGVEVLTIKMEANATFTLPASTVKGVHKTLYFYQGDHLVIEENKIPKESIIEVNPEEAICIQNGSKEAFLLVLQGKPLNEPVVQYGPFVMNTDAEIQEAFHEYQTTQFGGWPWPEQEQTHAKEKGRFAIHIDGREEIK